MADTVERLAKKQAERFDVPLDDKRRDDARWWLRAIAEELPNHVEGMLAAKWLREQADG